MSDFDIELSYVNAAIAASLSTTSITTGATAQPPVAENPTAAATTTATAPAKKFTASAPEFRPAAAAAGQGKSAPAPTLATPPSAATTTTTTGTVKIPSPVHGPVPTSAGTPPKVEGTGSAGEELEEVDDETHYYFYQASNSQLVFLHGINIKCLRTEFGESSHWPVTLSGVVLESTRASMTEVCEVLVVE